MYRALRICQPAGDEARHALRPPTHAHAPQAGQPVPGGGQYNRPTLVKLEYCVLYYVDYNKAESGGYLKLIKSFFPLLATYMALLGLE